jgi:hypothetical protein
VTTPKHRWAIEVLTRSTEKHRREVQAARQASHDIRETGEVTRMSDKKGCCGGTTKQEEKKEEKKGCKPKKSCCG